MSPPNGSSWQAWLLAGPPVEVPPDDLGKLPVERLLLPKCTFREGGTAGMSSTAASKLEAAAESIGREYAATILGASDTGDTTIAAGDIGVSAAVDVRTRNSAVGNPGVVRSRGVLMLKGFFGEDRGVSVPASPDADTVSYKLSSGFTRTLLRFVGVVTCASCDTKVAEALRMRLRLREGDGFANGSAAAAD